jgi:hypothetical protein
MFYNYLAIQFFIEIASVSREASFACVLISTLTYTLLGMPITQLLETINPPSSTMNENQFNYYLYALL